MVAAVKYLIIGKGRTARHFLFYLSMLKIAVTQWHRGHSLLELEEKMGSCSHVLLLINDDQIETFANECLPKAASLVRVHFSGALTTPSAFAAHPLMTFGEQLYEVGDYTQIPFTIDEDGPAFDVLLPGLPNPYFRLHHSLRKKYHAWCSLSGNLTCFLWQKFFLALQEEFSLPQEIAFPYLQQQMKNLLLHPDRALTGPLVRGDTKTLQAHLQALEKDAVGSLYASFIKCYEDRNK